MKNIMFFFMATVMMVACGSNKFQGGETDASSAPVDSLTKTEEVKPAPASVVKEPNMWTEPAVEAQIRACFAEVNRMAAADGIVSLPMRGGKASINVGNAAAAILYAVDARRRGVIGVGS